MKAISLLQPWASLVVMGAKKFETRSWNTKFRGRILIHASARKDQIGLGCCMESPFTKYINGIKAFYSLPFGAVIGECEIVNTHRTEDAYQFNSEQDEWSFGDYGPGRYAWELNNAFEYQNPIPFKGSLSIWDFPDDVLFEKMIIK